MCPNCAKQPGSSVSVRFEPHPTSRGQCTTTAHYTNMTFRAFQREKQTQRQHNRRDGPQERKPRVKEVASDSKTQRLVSSFKVKKTLKKYK